MAAGDAIRAAIHNAAAAAGTPASNSFGDPDGAPTPQPDGSLKTPGGAFAPDPDGNDGPMTALTTGIQDYVDAQTGGPPVVPRVGDIILTDTSVNATAPSGWQFADGTNGTPNIADVQAGVRYIIRTS